MAFYATLALKGFISPDILDSYGECGSPLGYHPDRTKLSCVHRSQNRIESYHQLRSAIAKVGGGKELAGRTDVAIEVSNQCGRLLANALVHYTLCYFVTSA